MTKGVFCFSFTLYSTRRFLCFALATQGGDFDDLYPDVCVEGLEKDPFRRTRLVLKHTHNEGIFFIVYTHI